VTRPITREAIRQELARARGARRLLPWAGLSALAGGAIGVAAGGGLRAGAALFVAGLLFVAFLWATSKPRCPACGAGLPRDAGVPEACARCRVRYEP
jgi:hypothetical protein